jgi:two-component system response regulator FixJ
MHPEPVVHVIDDDEAVRQSLALLLTSAGLRAQTYDGPRAFLAALPAMAPGCIITDMRMPGMSGLELMVHLGTLGSTRPVILITGHADVALAVEAMKRGAVDFLEKPFDDAALISAVRKAVHVGPVDVAQDADARTARAAVSALSAREKDVVRGLVDGKTNKMIARDLGISARTVEEYRATAKSKLGVRTLPALVRIALRAGL